MNAALAQSRTTDSPSAIVNERPIGARVLGGADAEPGEYPSMVALVRQDARPLEQRLFCGGTIVADRWILTAAHCVLDVFNRPLSTGRIRVVAGINDLALETPDTEHSVIQIVIHPGYDDTLVLPPNDIALLELETPVAAPSVTLFTGETNDYTDSFGIIAGWGATGITDTNTFILPTVLQDAAVPLITNALCNAPESYNGLIVDRHLCAGFADGQVDTCAGDSGGPLFIQADGVRVQAGITSLGTGCGQPFFYGIYTNVSHFIPWLSSYIEVPYQSPELIASRQARKNRGLFGGVGGITMLLLLFAVYFRAWHPTRTKQG
ncbi:MAG: serine protease [Granulosicoccus sp.]